MKPAKHYLAIGMLLSCLVHGAVLVGAKLLSDPTLLATTSEEIYEASDLTLDYLPGADQETGVRTKRAARHHVTQIEFIRVQGDWVDKLTGRSGLIARQVEDERLKAKKKTIPVVKNPSVKPRLVKQTSIPYPVEAGGEAGVTVVCFLVGYDGVPEYTSTAESSGNRFLDAAAVETCFNWRFSPAKDARGRLVRCLVYIPVTVKP